MSIFVSTYIDTDDSIIKCFRSLTCISVSLTYFIYWYVLASKVIHACFICIDVYREELLQSLGLLAVERR